MIGTALAAALALAPRPAGAGLPAEPWPRAIACSALLFVASENLKTAQAGKFGPRTGWTLNTLRGAWYSLAKAQPEYSADRFSSEMGAYVQGPLGSSPDALNQQTRAANLETCIDEGVKAEFERE